MATLLTVSIGVNAALSRTPFVSMIDLLRLPTLDFLHLILGVQSLSGWCQLSRLVLHTSFHVRSVPATLLGRTYHQR